MKNRKIFSIILIIVLALSITSIVYAKDIECKNFKIEIPNGYDKTDNYDNINHGDYLYISTGISDDKSSICVQELGEKGKTKEYSGLESDYLSNKKVEKTESFSGGFAEKCSYTKQLQTGAYTTPENFTYAEFETGGYTYGVIITHSEKTNYDDSVFQKDISTIMSISSSLQRK